MMGGLHSFIVKKIKCLSVDKHKKFTWVFFVFVFVAVFCCCFLSSVEGVWEIWSWIKSGRQKLDRNRQDDIRIVMMSDWCFLPSTVCEILYAVEFVSIRREWGGVGGLGAQYKMKLIGVDVGALSCTFKAFGCKSESKWTFWSFVFLAGRICIMNTRASENHIVENLGSIPMRLGR